MRKSALIALITLLANTAVYAQESNNPNDSSYPASNQPNAFPNDPDHTYGHGAGTLTLPSGVSPLSGTTSNPEKPVIPDKTGTQTGPDDKDK